ncbi:MAG TPA: hypothetical protein VGA16_08260 [Candidatus Limnocylindria bacterium]
MSVHVATHSPAAAVSRREGMEQNLRPIVGGLTLLLLLLVLIVPALRDPKPHDIPVALVGPAAATALLEQRFASAAPGAFRFVGYASEEDARRALDSREVSGALILRPNAPTLIVAGAAGGGVSGAINGAIGTALRAQGGNVSVETVHPFASADPQGLILFFLILGLTASAIAAGAIAATRSIGSAAVVTVASFAVLAGLVGPWTVEALGAGGYGDRIWLIAALAALGAGAVGLATLGTGRLLGPAGLGLAGLGLGPINLIASGGPIGSSFLPDLYRAIAPWMPATQMSSAFRGAMFFDGAGVGEPIATLAVWAIAGIVVAVSAELVTRSPRRMEAASR